MSEIYVILQRNNGAFYAAYSSKEAVKRDYLKLPPGGYNIERQFETDGIYYVRLIITTREGLEML